MSMYASTNSCVDRLNTESGRDPASQLTQIADKRRERATPAETDEQKQERLEERNKGRHSTQTANGTCQREYLAAETTADKDTRFQQMSVLQHKPKC